MSFQSKWVTFGNPNAFLPKKRLDCQKTLNSIEKGPGLSIWGSKRSQGSKRSIGEPDGPKWRNCHSQGLCGSVLAENRQNPLPPRLLGGVRGNSDWLFSIDNWILMIFGWTPSRGVQNQSKSRFQSQLTPKIAYLGPNWSIIAIIWHLDPKIAYLGYKSQLFANKMTILPIRGPFHTQIASESLFWLTCVSKTEYLSWGVLIVVQSHLTWGYD